MKTEFVDYCKSLQMGSTLIKQVTNLHEECCSLVPECLIEDILVSEYVTNDATRQFNDLYFFTNSFVFELIDFVATPEIWIRHYGSVAIRLKKQDFNLMNAKDSSRLKAEVQWSDSSFELNPKASGDNCVNLVRILKKYFFPYATGIQKCPGGTQDQHDVPRNAVLQVE